MSKGTFLFHTFYSGKFEIWKDIFFTVNPDTEERTVNFRRLISPKPKQILTKIFNEETQIFLSDTQDIEKENSDLYLKQKESSKISVVCEYK